MTPSIVQLSKYLSYPDRIVSFSSGTEEDNGTIPRNGRTCLAVVCYVLKFCSNSYHEDTLLIDTIRHLNDLASEHESWPRNTRMIGHQEPQVLEMERQISEIFVNSFMPNVHRFFNVPKPQDLLSEKDNGSIPKRNEILAVFIHFLLQILNCEEDHIQSEERTVPNDVYVQFTLILGDEISLRKDLTFLLTYLGDIPFQRSEPEEIKNLLTDFKVIADEAGSFVYSCIFASPDPNNSNIFYVFISDFMEKIDILNSKIHAHFTNFSTSCMSSATSKAVAVDSLFIVDSLLDDLNNIVNGRVYLIDDMKDHIITLHQLLISTRSFLKDTNEQQDTEIEESKECLVRIVDLGYEAEYLINSFVVGSIPVWYLKLRLPDVVQKFELVTTEYKEIKNSYGVKVELVLESSNVQVLSQEIQTSMLQDIVVGFEDEMTNILDKLTGGSKNLQILSIFGMPGLGKTTLTRKLYNDRLVSYNFDKRAWCVASQTYNKKNVLIDLLISSSSESNKESLLLMDDESLAIMIHKSLMGRRYLIVMDDVWSSQVWDDLRRYFPDNNKGSRILFTSRIRGIVPIGSIIQTLPFLSDDQCWELLQKKVFRQEPCPSQLVPIGKQIAEKCNGLPLEIVVIAGILANMEKEENVWKEVEESLDLHASNCMKILELSYKHLPNRLKLCFLYLGAFPEDTEIRVKRLILLWISEGFIREEEAKSPETIAKTYLMELVDRSLVLIAKNGSTGEVKACSVHDLLRDMCIRKAHEESFMNLIKDDSFSTYVKHHRLCVNSAAAAYLRPFSLRCRSFLGHLSDPSSCLPQMKLLKVMELPRNEDMDFYYRLTRIDCLVYLRYLVVDRLPEPIFSYLINLEFLRIDSLRHSIHVPSIILKMPKLKHLHIRIQAKFKDDCDTSQTFNLETLSLVGLYTNKAYEVLRASPHLRKLKCLCLPLLPDLRFLTKLESLKIMVRDIFQLPSNPTHIYFPSTIKKLCLYGTFLPWEKMSVLGRLPNLQALKLLMDAFDGEEWETSEEEFQELRFLKLDRLKLKNWIASSEHFPRLRHLVLLKCEELQNFPTELGDITTLEMIEVQNCSYEPSISAVKIEQEQLENGNVDLKVLITNSEWSKEQLVQKYHEES